MECNKYIVDGEVDIKQALKDAGVVSKPSEKNKHFSGLKCEKCDPQWPTYLVNTALDPQPVIYGPPDQEMKHALVETYNWNFNPADAEEGEKRGTRNHFWHRQALCAFPPQGENGKKHVSKKRASDLLVAEVLGPDHNHGSVYAGRASRQAPIPLCRLTKFFGHVGKCVADHWDHREVEPPNKRARRYIDAEIEAAKVMLEF
jgi:hypothetical protein